MAKRRDASSRAMELLDDLNEQRKERCLCDVTLLAGCTEFPAHKNLLAAASPFFKAMFNGSFRERHEDLVDLRQSVSSTALKVLLDHVYTTSLKLTVSNVADVALAADFLQMKDARSQCELFMRERARGTGCAQFFHVARLLNMQQVALLAKEYILGNFLDVFIADGLEVLDSNTFREIASSNHLRVDGKEIDVFYVVCAWLKMKNLTQKETDAVLAECVHYTSISLNHLIYEVLPDKLFNTQLRMKLVEDAVDYQTHLYKQPRLVLSMRPRGVSCVAAVAVKPIRYKDSTKTARPRLFLQQLVGYGNCGTSLVRRHVKFSVPLEPGSVHCVAHGASFVFALGESATSEHCVLLRYSLKSDSWMRLQSPPFESPLRHVMMTCSEDAIYVMGGTDSRRRRVDTCYKYVIEENNWETMPRMPNKLSSSGICRHSNGEIYIAGGYASVILETHKVDTLYSFHTESQTWWEKTPMNIARAKFSLVQVKDKLYAMYGAKRPGRGQMYQVEEYNVQLNEWTFVDVSCKGLTNMLFPETGSSCVFNGDVIVSSASLLCPCKHDVYLLEWLAGKPFTLNKNSVTKLQLDCDIFGVVTVPL